MSIRLRDEKGSLITEDEQSKPRRLELPQSTVVLLPPLERDKLVAIRYVDLTRICRKIRHLARRQSQLSVWYSICFGFAGSALLSLITLYCTSSVVTPAALAWLWILCLTTLFTGIGFVWADRLMSQVRRDEVAEIEEELGAIIDSLEAENGKGPRNRPSL